MSDDVRGFPDALAVRASHVPDRLAHDDTTATITFAEWDRAATELAGGLVAEGVEPGDRVLLPITNTHATQFAVAYIGVQRAGAIAAPVNTRLRPAEVAFYTELLDARWAITDVPDLLADLRLRSWSVDTPPNGAPVSGRRFDLDDDADILSTSGTTGRPKGVVSSHAETVTGLGDLAAIDKSSSLGFGGCRGCMMLPIRIGTSVITQPRFDPEAFLALADERGATSLQLVPAMLRLIVEHQAASDHELADVRWVFTGTAPLPQDTVSRFESLWPHIRLINVYGQTEGASGASTRSSTSLHKVGSVGRPADPEAIEIRDGEGRSVDPGTVGAIWVRTSRPKRYWNDPDATAATWKDGWLDTGDVGYVDGDGDLILTGRSKEIIIRGGSNVSPAEIEDVLHAHPSVSEAAVVGVDHPVLGQDVAAAVVVREDALDVDSVRSWCAERLADYKVPRTVEVLGSLPRNANGKVIKAELEPVLQTAADRRRA